MPAPLSAPRHRLIRSILSIVVTAHFAVTFAAAQTLPLPPDPNGTPITNAPTATPPPAPAAAPAPAPQSSADRLAQSNRELLDLLKKQQAVLEDIQYDRRLLNRQIQTLSERLTDALMEKNQLENKISLLEQNLADAKSAPAAPTSTPAAAAPTPTPTPPPPSTYLPPPERDIPGTKTWHRLFTLKGSDAKTSELFHIEGPQWRVVWHNLDKPGDAYKNTSALFINAFPKDDTIPQKVCAKLGTGGDATELRGPGNYYLKIEASGGTWELAVEDFK